MEDDSAKKSVRILSISYLWEREMTCHTTLNGGFKWTKVVSRPRINSIFLFPFSFSCFVTTELPRHRKWIILTSSELLVLNLISLIFLYFSKINNSLYISINTLNHMIFILLDCYHLKWAILRFFFSRNSWFHDAIQILLPIAKISTF